MATRIRIAIDAMSGDLGPRVAILATQKFVTQFPDVDLLLVGDQGQLAPLISKFKHLRDRVILIHAASQVTMDDDPLVALRQKKDSSMWIALDALRKGDVDACVSAGNTGALLAMAKYLIKTFPAVERPAICKAMPVETGRTFLLDLGANINCTPAHLHQFALMGNILAAANIDSGMSSSDVKAASNSPRIALLNIGTESHKGTDIIQSTQQLLQIDKRINYVGFIEADAIFSGRADVIVCDGFHGNIALKASEGVARFISKKITKVFSKSWFCRIFAFIFMPLLHPLRNQLDPSAYNGASFLGLQKVVIKSHGGANEKAFLQALIVAYEQVIQKVPERIQELVFQNNPQ